MGRARVRLAVALLCVTGCATAPSPPPPQPSPKPPETFDVAEIDRYVAAFIAKERYTGVGLGIAREGRVELAKGYGLASTEPRTAATADTSFALGSVTKQFTCVALLMLEAEGKISLNDPVSRFAPQLTRASEIHLRDLVHHVSGYRDYWPLDFPEARMSRSIDPDEIIQTYASRPLDFDPGSRWSYSNTGYLLAGRVVERVSGMPLGRFLETRIFRPLGMTHASLEPEAGTRGLATGYTSVMAGNREAAPREQPGWKLGAGGLYASVSDVLRWDLAIAEGSLLDGRAAAQFAEPRRLRNGRSTGYACGVLVREQSGETVLRHGGAVAGFLAYNVIVPRTRSALVLLVNDDDVDPGELGEALVKLLVATADSRPPSVDGPPAAEVARTLLRQLQRGEVDRKMLAAEFSAFLNDARLNAARRRLTSLGEPSAVEVERTSERGGLEFTALKLTFPSETLRARMFRAPDGTIEQFLILP